MTTEQAAASLGGLRTAIPELLVEKTAVFDVHYGIREDDSALVFHFFKPETGWPADITGRLEAAIAELFPLERVKADYTSELDSFCVIYYGGGMTPAPYGLAKLFLAAAQRPRDESESGSGTSP